MKTPKRQYERPKNRTKNPAFQMFGKMPSFPVPAGSTLAVRIGEDGAEDFSYATA